MSSSNVPLHPHQQMVSSSAGALLVSLFTTPFDVVKVRLQAQLKPERIQCLTLNKFVEKSLCHCYGQSRAYSSPVMCGVNTNMHAVSRSSSTYDAFTKIVRSEGYWKLWRGLSPTLVQMVPQTVIYFTAYDQLKFKFGYTPGEKNVIPSLCAGATGRVFAVVAVSPLEMMRTKLQSKKNLGYSQLLHIVRESTRKDGVLSLWRGIGPTILRDVPFSALYWVMYEALKSMHTQQQQQQQQHTQPTVGTNFTCGALAGSVAAFIVTPFDVVKTYRQMELGEVNPSRVRITNSKLPLTFQIMVKLSRTQGVTSLFSGLVPRIAKVAPSCAIMISTYEYGKKYFEDQNQCHG